MLTLYDLKTKLIDEKIIKNKPLKAISTELNLSNSYLTKFIDFIDNVEGCHELKFEILLKIIHRYYSNPKDILDIVVDYSKRVSKPQNLRLLLEFADEYQDLVLLAQIISDSRKSNNRNLIFAAEIYELIYKRKTSAISLTEYREQMAVLKSDNTSELNCLLVILETYILYDVRAYNLIKFNIRLLDSLILRLSCEEYLKERYYLRTEEIKMRYLLMSGQVVDSRETAKNILKISTNERIIASTYYSLGLSYLFTTYDKCEYYLDKASKHYGDSHKNLRMIIDNYRAFAKCIHDQSITEVDSLSEIDEIYWLIKTEDKQKAREKLTHFIKENDVKEYQLPYLIFLNGLLTQNKDLLWQSYSEYIQQGQVLFSKLPMMELEKTGTIYYQIDKDF